MKKYQVILAMFLAGCSREVTLYSCSVGGDGGKVDQTKLEEAIRKFSVDSALRAIDVRCPPAPALGSGAIFTCEVDMIDGGTYTAQVKIGADAEKASITWEPSIAGGQRLEREIEKTFPGSHIDHVHCGPHIFRLDDGNRITCTVDGERTGTVEVTYHAANDSISTEFTRAARWDDTRQTMTP